MVPVLVALVILGLLSVALVRLAATERKRSRMDERRLQADWLAESALERASARLQADPDYTGETWEPSADELGGRDAGSVTIAVEAVEGHPGRRAVRAQADYPKGSDRRARRTARATIELGPEGPGGER
jgi:type II secretory pathway pseudopilin PulG